MKSFIPHMKKVCARLDRECRAALTDENTATAAVIDSTFDILEEQAEKMAAQVRQGRFKGYSRDLPISSLVLGPVAFLDRCEARSRAYKAAEICRAAGLLLSIDVRQGKPERGPFGAREAVLVVDAITL